MVRPTRFCLSAAFVVGAAVILSTGRPVHGAKTDPRPSLCSKGEVAVFSCSTGAKVISLCASPQIDTKSGYLQYRFGTLRKIELLFPAKTNVRPQTVFRRGVSSVGGGGTDFLRFSNKGVTYTLFTFIHQHRTKDGLVLSRKGNRLATLICNQDALDPDHNWSLVYKAKLPMDETLFAAP